MTHSAASRVTDFSHSAARRDTLADEAPTVVSASNSNIQEYLKIFLIALVTSVAVLFSLGPVMMKLQNPPGPRAQNEAPTSGTGQAQPTAGQAPATQMTAPNLHGLELREARERWRGQGIVIIEDSQRVDNSVEAGTILSQSPSGGAPLQTKEIRVVVAAPPEMVKVPSVIGKPAAEATEELVDAGFEVPTPEREASSEPAGQVLRQEPNAGSKSEKGSLVRLFVSGDPDGAAATAGAGETGGDAPPTSEQVHVPKVTRMRLSAARAKIEKAGLVIGSVREREDEEMSGQRVISQHPSPGVLVDPGSEVDLVVVAPD